MHEDTSATSEIKIIANPSHSEIQVASDWLANNYYQTPDLELALNYLLHHQIVPHKRGLLAIAHTKSTNLNDIKGIVMMKPGNNLLLESSNCSTAEYLFAIATASCCPKRVFTSSRVKEWIRPILLKHYSLEREYDQLVMICTKPPIGGEGRWALPQDKEALESYASAYLAERGSGSLNHNWDNLIQQRLIAVIEHDGHVVSVVRYSSTKHNAFIIAPFTFPKFRRQGFAQKLLAFFASELLKEYPSVKLWVDEDNVAATTLYCSLGFKQVGRCYTGYFK